MSKLHGRSCKNQAFVLFAIECVWKLILEGFWGWDGAFLRPDWPLEAYSKAMLMKYVFLKGSESVGVS